jgi:hypothetical protein
MPNASVSIAEPKTSQASHLNYRFVLRDAKGETIAGEEVSVTLEGDGSLAPGFSSKEIRRETGADGSAIVTWYRSGIWGRGVKASLTVLAPRPDCSVSLEAAGETSAEAGSWISWTPSRGIRR